MHTKHILIWLNLGWFRDVKMNFKKGHLIKVNCQIRGSRDQPSVQHCPTVYQGSTDLPVLVVLAQIIDRAVRWISADGSTQTGFFPPSSRTTGVKYSAAALITNFPIFGPPVKNIISNLKKELHEQEYECYLSLRRVTLPGPSVTTTGKASESRYFGTSSIITWVHAWQTSDGLITH